MASAKGFCKRGTAAEIWLGSGFAAAPHPTFSRSPPSPDNLPTTIFNQPVW